MEKLSLTVSQLTCACIQPGWLDAWLQGKNPGTASYGGDGTPVHGARLHLVAANFVQWALTQTTAPSLVSATDIYPQLLAHGGQALMARLLQAGKIAEAVRVSENIEHLSQHFSEVRKNFSGFTSWADVYVAQEYALKKIPIWEEAGKVLLLSGRMDALRVKSLHPSPKKSKKTVNPQALLIADYKFTAGDDLGKDLVQLALYQRLLKKQHGISAEGCLEYMWPKRHSTFCSAAELEQVFQNLVAPVLQKLFSTPVSSEKTPWRSETSPPALKVPETQPATVSVKPATPETLTLGAKRNDSTRSVELPLALLTRHTAVLGGSGSGKTTAALTLIEQVLQAGVPVVLLDRKGDLCRYAQPEAWNDPAWPPPPHHNTQRRQQLRERLAITLYTPGSTQGKGLRLPLAPAGLGQLPAAEREQAALDSASVLATALGIGEPRSERAKGKLATLICAFQVLAARLPERAIELEDLLHLLSELDTDLIAAMGHLDTKLCTALLHDVQSFKIMKGALLDPRAELLDWAQLLSPRADGRVPLSIVSTKFLGSNDNVLFWVAQFFLELLRHISRQPSDRLQGLLMLDEADLYMPATRAPATKGPLESLLKRARSGGIGLMLCTQSPGDLDYKGRENILTWLIGLIKEERAKEKLAALLEESRIPADWLSRQSMGQFILATQGQTTPLNVWPNQVQTRQLAEPEILWLARQAQL